MFAESAKLLMSHWFANGVFGATCNSIAINQILETHRLTGQDCLPYHRSFQRQYAQTTTNFPIGKVWESNLI